MACYKTFTTKRNFSKKPFTLITLIDILKYINNDKKSHYDVCECKDKNLKLNFLKLMPNTPNKLHFCILIGKVVQGA